MTIKSFLHTSLYIILFSSCKHTHPDIAGVTNTTIDPAVVTQTTLNDTDDPAIWINRANPAQSLVIGTDKGDETGGVYVFSLDGKIDHQRSVSNMKRPNNIDIEYNFPYMETQTDIAVCTERGRQMMRVFSVPDMKPIDNGGISVFEGETLRDPMGIALYKHPKTDITYAFVGRKEGTDGSYIWQYQLVADENGIVSAKLVRKLGSFSGKKEIEAIVVDDALGYLYYSDEQVGVRKYYAEPDSSNIQLALFAAKDVVCDHEGLTIYQASDSTGYIILSDQGANRFQVFPREGTNSKPHNHPLLKVFNAKAIECDGCDITHLPMNDTFKHGMFVAMSTDKTFHFYKWEDIAGKDLTIVDKE